MAYLSLNYANDLPPSPTGLRPIFRESSSSSSENQDNHMQTDVVSIVSPYPFSHASQEEIAEREQLHQTMSWPSDDDDACQDQSSRRQDPSFYFDIKALKDREMDCDDFSISSDEADTLEDLGESFSTDPESFWGAPVSQTQPQTSPVQEISVQTDVENYPVPVIPTSTVLHLPELSC